MVTHLQKNQTWKKKYIVTMMRLHDFMQ